jgi:hypothetical protein
MPPVKISRRSKLLAFVVACCKLSCEGRFMAVPVGDTGVSTVGVRETALVRDTHLRVPS